MEFTYTPPIDDPKLSALTTSDDLANYLKQRRIELADRVRAGAGGIEIANANSDMVDGLLRRMLTIAYGKHHSNPDPSTAPICVVATGGYGRRELCPFSDIDITFIPYRDGDRLNDLIIKDMFTMLMRVFIDANGMDVGYAYRLMEDCATLDPQTISGLMDARLIAGNNRLFIQFEAEYWMHYNSADFIFNKVEERAKAREKAGVTPRIVEPNVKEGAGGLRDLHTAVWVTQARSALPAARVRGDRAFEVLEREGGVTPIERSDLTAAKEFLFRTRNALHVVVGAERDQLVVTRQEEVAEILGYREDAVNRVPAVEIFMRDYYRHVSCVYRISSDVVRRAKNSRLFLGIGLDCLDRQVVPANPALKAEDPVWMLWACELAQKYGLTLSDQLQRVMIDLLATNPTIVDLEQAAESFTRILSSPSGAYTVLQRMATLGVLSWLFPEVGDIMNLIPYDPSHEYTVGQHTLYVIQTLDSLRQPDCADEARDFRALMHEIPHPEQLILAALLHDAGKSDHSRPHAETGAEIAFRVCQRLRWNQAATENVAFLIRNHLLMAEVSRLRDLNLDETIRDFTAVVDDHDRLHMLYLLTYADTRAVGAGVWTQVKAKFLRDLHQRAERMISGDEGDDYTEETLARTRRRLLKELSVENIPRAEISEHVACMPSTYLLNTTMEEIALHIGFVRRARTGEPVVEFHDERGSTFTEVTVCTQDDPEPGLLAKITGVFLASDLAVHSSQVFTRVGRHERIAIDTFTVDFRGKQLTSGKRHEVATHMAAVLTGKSTVAELIAKRRKPTGPGLSIEKVNLRNDLSDTYTVIEVVAPENRAMLHRASGALSQLHWDIHSAKVSQFRGRSVAVFYVYGARRLSDADARKVLLQVIPIANQP